MTQQSHPDTIAAIDAVLAHNPATSQPRDPNQTTVRTYLDERDRAKLEARAATAEGERDALLRANQQLAARLRHADAEHGEALADLTAVWTALNTAGMTGPTSAAELVTRLAAQRDAERLAAHTWATRAGLAQRDRNRLEKQRDEMQILAAFRLGVIRRHTDETTAAGRVIAAVRDTVEQLDRAGVTIEALDRALAAYDAPGDLDATLAQIRRDATQLQADLDAGRVADRLGEPAPIGLHVTRGTGPGDLEAGCPCAKAPCGGVDTERTDPACDQHPPSHGRTMRQMHRADQCPAAAKPDPDAGLAGALEHAASVRIDGRDVIWYPTPGGWHHTLYGFRTLDEIHEEYGQTRPALLVYIDDDDEPTAPVPVAPAQELDLVALLPWIRRALADPGSIAGRRRSPMWPEAVEGHAEEEETVTEWNARALRLVLGGLPWCERCDRAMHVNDAYDPPLPGIGLWEHRGECPPAEQAEG